MRKALSQLVVVVLASSLLAPWARPAQAAGVVGTGTPASCTQAELVSAMSGGGVVTFNCGPNPHTIVLTSGAGLSPTAGVGTAIDGGGLITLSAGNVTDRRIFGVVASAALTLTRLTLVNATVASGPGGAIYNLGRLVLEQVVIEDTGAQGFWGGGAIYHNGQSLVVRSSILRRNYSAGGSAIYNDAGRQALVENSQFISNTVNGAYGGAIHNNGVMTITGSAFTGNRQTLAIQCPNSFDFVCGGGAIANFTGGTLLVSNSVFLVNSTSHRGGAILNRGELTVAGSTFTLNVANDSGGAISGHLGQAALTTVLFDRNTAIVEGGGMQILGGVASVAHATLVGNATNGGGGGFSNGGGKATLTHVTLDGNIAGTRGGGINSISGPITLTHVTLSGNTASSFAGGMYNGSNGVADLTYVTLTGNSAELSGAGLYNSAASGGAAGLYLTNVLFANNRLTSGTAQNCGGLAPTVATFNLTTDNTCVASVSGNRVNVPVLLGPLAFNGGDTRTHLPAPGSEPINHGACVDGLSVDQRGLPRLVGAGCDIGAVERQAVDFGWYVFLPLSLR